MNLRRAIDVATVSKANHEAIQVHIVKTKEEREQDIASERRNLLEQEERMYKEQVQKEKEAYQARLDLAQGLKDIADSQKEAKRQYFEEKMSQERELVRKAIQGAIAERQAWEQQYAAKKQRATQERVEFEQQKIDRVEHERYISRLEDEQIALHQKAQQGRDKERRDAQVYRQSQFDALLQKMTEINRAREAKAQKLENLRIQISEFYEEQRKKQQEIDRQQFEAKMREELIAEMRIHQQKRTEEEVARREEEEFYK